MMVIKKHLFDFLIDLDVFFFPFKLCEINIHFYVFISKLFKVSGKM